MPFVCLFGLPRREPASASVSGKRKKKKKILTPRSHRREIYRSSERRSHRVLSWDSSSERSVADVAGFPDRPWFLALLDTLYLYRERKREHDSFEKLLKGFSDWFVCSVEKRVLHVTCAGSLAFASASSAV